MTISRHHLVKLFLLLFIFYSGQSFAARISLGSLQAEIDALKAQVADLQQQIDDLSLTPGPRGENGSNGLSCWDTNGNGIRDDAEDINSDGSWDSADCAGTGDDLTPLFDLINDVSARLALLEARLQNLDADNDGFTPGQGDCDDANNQINPAVTEIVGDGIDNDCDGTIDLPIDNDGDGFTVEQGDCDNFDATVYPGAPELSDGKDNDCDGTLDDEDQDRDGFSKLEGDCNDADSQVFPGAPERPNFRDDNCNGTISDEDHDFDGFTRADDCDDNDSNVKPSQTAFFRDRSRGGTFDYNCDGTIEFQRSQKSSCVTSTCGGPFNSHTCSRISESGWKSVPGCGVFGTWQTESGLFSSGSCSSRGGQSQVQSCR